MQLIAPINDLHLWCYRDGRPLFTFALPDCRCRRHAARYWGQEASPLLVRSALPHALDICSDGFSDGGQPARRNPQPNSIITMKLLCLSLLIGALLRARCVRPSQREAGRNLGVSERYPRAQFHISHSRILQLRGGVAAITMHCAPIVNVAEYRGFPRIGFVFVCFAKTLSGRLRAHALFYKSIQTDESKHDDYLCAVLARAKKI